MIQGNQEYIQQCIEAVHAIQQEADNKNELFYELLKEREYPLPAFLYLKEALCLSPFMSFVVLMAFVYEVDTKTVSYIEERTQVKFLSLGIVISLYLSIESKSCEIINEYLNNSIKDLLFVNTEETYTLQTSLMLRKEVLHYLIDGAIPSKEGVRMYIPCNVSYLAIYKEERKRITTYIHEQTSILLQGAYGSGKKTLVYSVAEKIGIGIVILNMRMWRRKHRSEQEQLMQYILFILRLQQGVLYIEHAKDLDCEDILYIQEVMFTYKISIIVACEQLIKLSFPIVRLPHYLSMQDMHIVSNALWNKNWQLSQYSLNPSDFIKVYHDVKNGATLSDSCKVVCHRNHETSPFYRVIEPIEGLQNWVGNQEIIDQFKHIIFTIEHKVEIKLRMVNKNRTFTILFHGPSGTGKSLAAGILAKETGLPLWQIDLSNIMDKYIGESEKHLRKIFQDAKKGNCILLFDEADVIFAKRTNITSSNDKYANSSTAYLLQELENYEGVVILTSNYIQNFDDAFLRRIQYIIRFPLPDEQAKIAKWRQCLCDLSQEDLSIEELSKDLQLSLSQIETVCLNAMIYAMEENVQKIMMRHLLKAVKQEYQKKQIQLPHKYMNL